MMIYGITCAFIALDFISGLVKAIATNCFKSSMMREGLFHKVGELLCIALGVLIECSEQYLDLGITIPVAAAICAYIVLMEIGSTIENLGKISPELVPSKIRQILGLREDNQ